MQIISNRRLLTVARVCEIRSITEINNIIFKINEIAMLHILNNNTDQAQFGAAPPPSYAPPGG